MSNIFSDHPIVLNVINTLSFSNDTFIKKIKQQIIWVSSNDTKKIKIWDSPSQVKKKYPKVKIFGGVDDSPVIDHDAELDNLDNITFDDDDINELFNDDTDAIQKKDIVDVEQPFILVTDVHIFPDDNISDFKQKAYIATKIPPYRQHLWCEFKGKTMPLGYFVNGPVSAIDIKLLCKNNNFYEGIPTDTHWYAHKENILITALDNFQLLGHLFYKFGITQFFMVDLNDFINPIRGNLEQLLKKDMYSIELIYYSFIMKYWPHLTITVFGNYLKNEYQLSEAYPDLSPSITRIKKKFKTETAIYSENYIPEFNAKKRDVPIYSSITHSVISVTDVYVIPNTLVQLRNLFDIFDLTDIVNLAIAHIEVGGRVVVLSKTYKNVKNNNKGTPIGTILFNIKIPNMGNMQLIINKKGSYKIKSKWKESHNFNFEMIYNHIKMYIVPVLEKINNFKHMVSNLPLTIISSDNSIISSINSSINWKFTLSKIKFQNVKILFNKYVDAGILIKNFSTLSQSYDFYFVKGMHKYDTTRYKMVNFNQNQFQYLSDANSKNRYHNLIMKQKKISIFHRFSDVKIEFSGINEQEYGTIYTHILRFLESIPRTQGTNELVVTKKLKRLKEKDPALYEFKKTKGPNVVYSKLCQQQKQPIVFNQPGKNRVKFWNITTDEPAYYECPNPKYPYINFITHAHPDKYCIPCCYKLPPSTNEKDKKYKVYKTCMSEKKFVNAKTTAVKSRYVVSYGKDIEVGRISKLPENTLEPLFYDTFSVNSNGIDDECSKDMGYYIFGVPQHVQNVSNVGFLFTISHSIGKNVLDFVSETIKLINKKKEIWTTLLHGEILVYFKGLDDMVNEMYNTFIGTSLSTFDRWNELFINITRIYWHISIIHFIDEGGDESNIYLNIPSYIQYFDDYKTTNKHLIIIERDKTFNPMYVIFKDIFFKHGKIHAKLFDYSSQLITEIHKLAKHTIKRNKSRDAIDLHLIKWFVKNSKYNIVKQYINGSDFCYGVLLKHIPEKKIKPFYTKGVTYNEKDYAELVATFTQQNKKKGTLFYFPIKESFYVFDKTPITFDLVTSNNIAKLEVLTKFTDSLNSFIKEISKIKLATNQLLYPVIEIEIWLLFNGMVIGYKNNSINIFIKPIAKNNALKMAKKKFIQLKYHPHMINTIIHDNQPPINDRRTLLLAKSLYNKYLHSIVIIELINIMNKQRNNSVRDRIKSLVKKITCMDPQLKELKNVLLQYPDDFTTIKKHFILYSSPSYFDKKNTAFPFLIKKKIHKNDILNIIDSSVFSFDKKMFTVFKKMDHTTLKKKLYSVLSAVVVHSDPDLKNFPNVINLCDASIPYCKNKKLLISKKKLDNVIETLAADILNPVKSKYIFNPMFITTTVDYFKFIIRENEYITVSI
jgi:hypothetical protein